MQMTSSVWENIETDYFRNIIQLTELSISLNNPPCNLFRPLLHLTVLTMKSCTLSNVLNDHTSCEFLSLSLKEVTLRGVGIDSLPSFSSMKRLQSLDLGVNQIKSLSGLTELNTIKYLNLEKNDIMIGGNSIPSITCECDVIEWLINQQMEIGYGSRCFNAYQRKSYDLDGLRDKSSMEACTCINDPCEHGGLCSGNGRRWTCTCRKGYEGRRCEIEKGNILLL